MTTSAPPPKAPSPWDENKNSDGEIKGVELGFSSLTLSPHFSGGRPPALSVSSLSTIGDDHTQPQNRSGEGIMNTLVGTPPSPSSPPRRPVIRQVGPPHSLGEAYQGQSARGASLPSPIGTVSRPTTRSSSSNYAAPSPLIIRPSPTETSNSDPIFGSDHNGTYSFLTDKPPPPPPKLGSATDIDAGSINRSGSIEGKNNEVDKSGTRFPNHSIDAPIAGVPFSAVGHFQKDHRVGSLDSAYNMITNKNVITPRRSPKSELESPLLSSSFDQSHQGHPEQSPGSHYFDDGGLIGLGVLKDGPQSPPSPNFASPGGIGYGNPSSPRSEIMSRNEIPHNSALSTFSVPSDNRNTNNMLERLLTNADQSKLSVASSSRGSGDGSHHSSRPPLSSSRSSIEGKLNESPSFNSFEQHGAPPHDLLPSQQLDPCNSDMDFHGGAGKNRIDNALGGPPRPHLRHATSDITNGRARVSPGTSMFGGNSVSIGSSSSFVDEHFQAEHISRYRHNPSSRARAASMGSPDVIAIHEHSQPQGLSMSHAMGSFDDSLRGQSYQGHDSSFGANGNVGREEFRQMYLMKTQSIQTRQPMRSDNHHLRHPQILYEQQDQQQHQRQLHQLPHNLQGAPKRQNHQRHPQAQDYYDDGYGQQGHASIRSQQHANNIQHQRDAGGQFVPHNAHHQHEVHREPITPGTGGRPLFEHNSGPGPGMEGNRFDWHHRSISSGSDIAGMMNRNSNVAPHGTPLTPREGTSCREYGPTTIDPYPQNQQRFSGHQQSGHASQGQFHHEGDMGQLCQPHLGVNRGIQQRFSGEEFRGMEVVRGGIMHDDHLERRGSGGAPVFPHMEDTPMNVNDINANQLGMGRGNDPGQGPYGGNVVQHRSHGQQQHFAHGQRRVEPASPVTHHPSPIMLSPNQHHNRQPNRAPPYDADFGHPPPTERMDGSPMGIGMNMIHSNNSASQDSMNPHHPYQQAGIIATHMGARSGPMHHPASSPSQSISSGAPSVEQVLPPGLPPHFSSIDSAQQQQQQVTSGSTSAPGPRVVYNVKFKRTQRSFILGQRIPRDIKIGCYVKVEADRGEDLGIVLSRMPAEKFNASGRSNFRMGVGTSPGGVSSPGVGEISPTIGGVVPSGPTAGGAADLKRIIRLATHDEVSLLAVKREEEDELLKICKAKVRQRGLPMNVVDAEYQFDRHKLTFFFEAEGRIDFRELVRDLFSIYKTRIWMQQLDKNGASGGGGCGDQSSGSVSPSNDVGQSSVVSFTSEDSDSGRPYSSIARDSDINKYQEVDTKCLKHGNLATCKGHEETE